MLALPLNNVAWSVPILVTSVNRIKGAVLSGSDFQKLDVATGVLTHNPLPSGTWFLEECPL